jgi:predicted secreted protein
MTPRVGQAASVRPGASLVLVLGASMLTAPALAGDRAMIEYLGFSGDGRYFAFEEFGIQDGSGFPYSTIYVIDLPADDWVSGSPYRTTLEDDGADLEDARDAALEQAEAKLEALDISVAPYLIALNGDGEEIGDGHSLTFGDPGYGLNPIESPGELMLDTIPLPSNQDCSIIDDEVFGFVLSLDGEEIHADAGPLPASRGCVMDYRIHAVVRPAEWFFGGTPHTVAIISTYPFGFEGPDRRFLAVPLRQ